MLIPKQDSIPYADVEIRLIEIKSAAPTQNWENSTLDDLGNAQPANTLMYRLTRHIKRVPIIGPLAKRVHPYIRPSRIRSLVVSLLHRFPPALHCAKWLYQLLQAPRRQQDLHELLLGLNHRIAILEEQQQRTHSSMNGHALQLQKHTEQLQMLRSDLQRVEDIVRLQSVRPEKSATAAKPTHHTEPETSPFITAALDHFYKAFEDEFRGREHDISERLLSAYDTYLNTLRPGAKALDLGCGRGEWLKLLQSKGMSAKGIDLTASMVNSCTAQGLDVLQDDANNYLHNLEPDSLDLITAFHVAEHLPFPRLIELIVLARRALKPGGILILETPNPENLQVGANTFYMDPTHLHPLPPALLAFSAKSQGFSKTHIERLHPYYPEHEQHNETDKLLFGAQDYALIAWK